jgi:hypothetical protein
MQVGAGPGLKDLSAASRSIRIEKPGPMTDEGKGSATIARPVISRRDPIGWACPIANNQSPHRLAASEPLRPQLPGRPPS